VERSQRGFSLLETLVAVAVVTVIGFFVVSAIAQALRWNAAFSQHRMAEAAIGFLADRLEAEEDSAWAIFAPPLDAYGSSNADGHEVDFFFRDAQSRAHFIAYCYHKTKHRIQRLLYAKTGGAPAADGAPISGIDDFFAQTYPVTALQDPDSLVYSDLYRSAALHRAEVRFDRAQPWIAGGNQITYVRVRSAQTTREFQLSTQTAPSGFTIVLRYTPAPSNSPKGDRSTAAVLTAQVIGRWEDCPGHSACSNAEWPKYFWSQTTTSRYYESYDRGYSWTLFDTEKSTDTGINGPTGGDLPPPCQAAPAADYMRVCSPDWTPAAPPGTDGMEIAP
jgi:prepilin-type N-terminal cleavage/methylation domain-containing protein